MRKYFRFWWYAVLQIFLITLNLCEAAFHLYKHHWRLMAENAMIVGFLVGLNLLANLLAYKSQVKYDQIMTELHARHAEMIRALEARVMGPEAMAKAEKNLALVVKALGVEVDGNYYYLKIKKQLFRVHPGHVYQCADNYQPLSGTCIQNHGLPMPEHIATALLLLKNDPVIFHKWRNVPGTNYGA